MAIDPENTDSTTRHRAEAEENVAVQTVVNESLSGQDVERLYHELQIHQIELEMQNEELHLTKLDLEAARDNYFNLYDLAPVGYLTLNIDGLIQKSNLTASTMLGFGKDALFNKPIQKFIFRDDSDSYYLQSRCAIEASVGFKIELRFVPSDGSPIWVNLQASPQNDDELWIAFSDISDRKQLEQSLLQANGTLEALVGERTEDLCKQEERMRLALEAAKMATWDWHVPSGNVIWNEMHYRMMGYEPGEVQPSYQAWASRVHPDDIGTVQRMMQESFDGGTFFNAEFRTRWPDGTVRWLEARGETKYSANNEPQRQYGVMLDITDRKRAEEVIRKSEKPLSDIYASMSEGLSLHEIVYDNFGKAVDYLITEVNPAFERITGMERSTVIGKKASELYGTGEAPYLDRYAEVASTGEPTSFEVHFVPMNKHFQISVFSPENGHFATVFQDVTERNRTDNALRESEERHRVLAETMLQGVVHQDANGTIISMNPAAERILGKSREEFLGNSSVSVEHDTIRENGELFPGMEHPTMVALRTGLPAGGVVMGVFNPKVEEYRWIGIDAVPVFRPGDKLPAEVYSVFEDITERKQSEEALRKAHAELELRVAERTVELAQLVKTLEDEIHERQKAELKLQRLNSLYAILSETNQTIVKISNRNSLFRDFCRIAVEHGGFVLSWIGLVDGQSGKVTVVASSGATAYLNDIRISAGNEPEGEGPTGISIREGSYYICNDFLNDPCTRPWHDQGKKFGICASASIAIKENNRVIGALTLYVGEKDYFDVQQVELLLQMGMDISFALDNLNRDNSRKEAEKALYEETSERLKAVEILREKEQMLIQQNRQAAMGEMVGNIAHQWRQPLNTLGLYTQKLGVFYGSPGFNKELLDDSIAKSMAIINHMSKTIDDFRDYFKPEKEKADFYVNEAIKNALSLLEGSFQNPKITIDFVEHDNPVINGYQNEFAQVFLNILNNARDAIIERKINDARVTITICSENNCAVVTVADNAGGIPGEVINKVFDPYFTTKGPQLGTGIGLFMSKSIIEKNMGGRLTVLNTDVGAEFRIVVERN